MTRLDYARSEEIRKVLKQEAVVTQVTRKREWWKYKVMENYGSLIGKIIRGQVEGKRPRGRQRKDGVMISEVCRIVPYNLAI